MKGKTIVATGATSGIGEAAVLELARLGGRIVIVARDEARAQATMRKLEAKAPTAGHRLHLADLSSMAETRKVGAAIAASEPRIDVLINNAGALFSERRVTPEGLERTFALNHMAYFVLTQALRERLIASAPVPGWNGSDGELLPSWCCRDEIRRIERRLRRSCDSFPQAVFPFAGEGSRHTGVSRVLARGRKDDGRVFRQAEDHAAILSRARRRRSEKALRGERGAVRRSIARGARRGLEHERD